MQARKSYGQFCALARALDHIGDRWTLLIVRELLIGPKRFSQLVEALAGIATNLLTERLRQLEQDGIIERSDHPQRSAQVTYSLSPLGRQLEPAVFDLIRWGAVWMASGPGADRIEPHWAILALRALLESPAVKEPRGALKLDMGSDAVWAVLDGKGRRVTTSPPVQRERAVLSGDFPAVLAVASGLSGSGELNVGIEGDRGFAAAALGLEEI